MHKEVKDEAGQSPEGDREEAGVVGNCRPVIGPEAGANYQMVGEADQPLGEGTEKGETKNDVGSASSQMTGVEENHNEGHDEKVEVFAGGIMVGTMVIALEVVVEPECERLDNKAGENEDKENKEAGEGNEIKHNDPLTWLQRWRLNRL